MNFTLVRNLTQAVESTAPSQELMGVGSALHFTVSIKDALPSA